MYFNKISSNGVSENKHFWNVIKHFLTSKRFLDNNNTAINFDNKTTQYDKKLLKYSINFILIL